MKQMLDKSRIAFLYALFAAIATAVNIGTQALTVRGTDLIFGNYILNIPVLFNGRTFEFSVNILLSIICATGVGLLVKYILDKRYIFAYKPENLSEDSKTFILYTIMGIVTTVIFLGFEYTFEYMFNTEQMRYLGAVIGLAIGYWIKYRLDKKFVFKC